MAITHFRISKLPERVSLLKNGSAATLNQSYPISEENELSIDNQSGFKGQFLDNFNFQVSENEVDWSNEGVFSVADLVQENLQESANTTFLALSEQSYSLIIENLLPLNTSVDRIRITGFDFFGITLFNGAPVSINSEYFLYELSNLVFETKKGGADPYGIIKYQCGNHLGYNNTEYTITFSVNSLGELNFVSQSEIDGTRTIDVTTYNTKEFVDTIKIDKGLIGKIATIQFQISSPFFSDSIYNEIRIFINGNLVVKAANETFNILELIDNKGEIDIELIHYFVDINGTTTTSSVSLTLLDIDGNPANVSGTNTYTSTVNFN